MTLPASGPLSFSDIQTEFGGSAPISLSEYYGLAGLPASGPISVSDFYGKNGGQILDAGNSGAQIVGYQGGLFGAMTPNLFKGNVITICMDRNDGSSPVHQFWFQLDAVVAANFLTSIVFVDRFSITRTFLTAGGNSLGAPSFTTAGFSRWVWSCDAVTTSLFMASGAQYRVFLT